MRATGLQGDALPEIIEIIDDERDAFGGRVPDAVTLDTGGPKWVGPVAALALLGLITFGVASSSSSGDAPAALPASSTSNLPNTTVPAPVTTLPPEPVVPYYAANPPAQYELQQAETLENQGVFYGGDSYQLSATDGATVTSGSWVSLNSWEGAGPVYAQSAYREQVGDRAIAITRTSTGASIAQFNASPRVSVILSAFGHSDDELLQLAASVTETDGHVTFGTPALLADHQLLSTVQPWLAIQGVPLEQVNYGDTDDSSHTFWIGVSAYPPPSDDGLVGPADRQVALRFYFDHTTPFVADGHDAVAGTPFGQTGYAIATWIAGDHIVTVSGTLTEQQLIAIARTVHQVSAPEWRDMRSQAGNYAFSANDPGNYREELALSVSVGTDATGSPWTIRVANGVFGQQRQLSWKWGGNGGSSTPTDSAQITTVVDGLRTYVLADLPRAVSTTADLHISRAGLDPVIVPFKDVDPTLDRTFAAYAFSELGMYTAQIIDADGTVLASWPS